jgi:DNA-binding response OmpR family regulator
MVPFIFLTSLNDQDMEIRGFRAGADEYLIKPVDRKTLLEKVETLLSRAQRVKSVDDEKVSKMKGFEGNLADLSLVEMIQLINLNKRNGTLTITAQKTGKIVFANGEMIFAELGDQFSGEDAINQMIVFKEGSFKFDPSEAKDIKRNIEGSTMNVLLEACRLMDEQESKN